MKLFRFKSVMLAVGLLLAGCSPVTTMRNVVAPPVSWEFIQSVGGLSVGQPKIADNILWLPLTVDLSGARQISVAPTVTNSGKKCIRAELRQGNLMTTPAGAYDLYLQIYAGADDKQQEGGCDAVPLFTGTLKPPFVAARNMKFRIWYKDYVLSEHYITEVTLAP